jgi:uncharacterized repeat protein (TIGR03803 family)
MIIIRARLTLVSLVFALAGSFAATANAGFIFNSLVSFNGSNGYTPSGPLLQSQSGDFYGTTQFGGTGYSIPNHTDGFGTVFKYNLTGGLVSVASFNSNNGYIPASGLIQTANGLFYGTTQSGGAFGKGNVFRMNSAGVISNLASFDGTTGYIPNGLTKLNDQLFYGLSFFGGNPSGLGTTFGTVFKVDTNGNLSMAKAFDGTNNGANPLSSMVLANDGSFYGTATSGAGNYLYGTTFHFLTNGTLSLLDGFAFTNGADPTALILGQDGYYYGVTKQGGKYSEGALFRMSTTGALTNLFNFDSTNSGGVPGALVQGRNGVIYGIATSGGSFGGGINNGSGTVFQMTTNGQFSVLYVFTNGVDGGAPAGLIIGRDDNLYGSTSYGGSNNLGALFSLTVNPANPVITSINSTHGLITLNWTASAGYSYNVLYKNSVSATNWNILTNVIANNSVGIATDVIGTNSSRFYRVVLLENIVPTVTSFTDKTNHTTIKWAAVEGYTYEVVYKTNLYQTNWTVLQTVTTTGTNGVAVDNSAGGFSRFYDIVVVSPAPNITSLVLGRSQSTIQWVASPTSVYNVLFKSSLTGSWNVLQTVTANGPVGFLNFPTPTNSMGFFQVQFAP